MSTKLCEYAHCDNTFDPAGTRKQYCSVEHRRAHEVRAKRQWRRLVSRTRQWLTYEDALKYVEAEQAARREHRARQLRAILQSYESGMGIIFPDARYEQRRHREEPEDVSAYHCRSNRYAWQLDGRGLRERDRIAYGLPASYEVLNVTNARVTIDPGKEPSCNHWRDGLHKTSCEACVSRTYHMRDRHGEPVMDDPFRGRNWQIGERAPRES
jgi:hypothetical protein